MKKGTLLAAIVTPVVAASTGVMIARAGDASADNAGGYCQEPTVYLDMAEGVSMLTAGPSSDAQCADGACTVTGVEQVEINADGQVQCVTVGATQSLSLTRRGGGVSLAVEDISAR